MAVTLNSNVAALNAQRRLAQNTGSLQETFSRLSSGLRITKASDDPAGLQVASLLNVDARVYSQAVRNINDGLSLFAIADGAMSQLSDIITRSQELAEQAANGTLGIVQRKSLHAEALALRNEFNRIINTTSFNGLKLLDRSSGSANMQVGYDTLALDGISLGTLGVGDGTYKASTTLAGGSSLWSVISTDINGDGKLDLVSADYGASTISIYIGNGDGSFQNRIAMNTGTSPRQVIAADVNGDGKIDLVSSDAAAGRVSVFLGNGDATFNARMTFTVGSFPASVAKGDVNGDGKLDLITANYGTDNLSVLIGNGNGTFKAGIALPAGDAPHSVSLADFNGDGKLDLVSTGNLSGDVSVFLGNGNGTFKASVFYTVGTHPHSVISADVSGDGIIDLISADAASGTLSVLIGNGDGSFKTRTPLTTGFGSVAVITADVNGDGNADLISADSGSNCASVYIGNGDGTFKARAIFNVGADPHSVTAADLNNDGVLDLITAGWTSGRIDILLGNGSVGLAAVDLRSASTARSALEQLSSARMNVTNARAQIGAQQSRLQVAAANMFMAQENYMAAAGQIMNVDVSEEAARLLRTRILQQAGSAVLAQANQAPALALKLLNF